MSVTAQCAKPKSEAATWTTLFEDVDTSSTKSVLFMKKLLALGVSNILFWRGLLPEAAFGERMVGEHALKILRNEKDCPAAQKIIGWIKASFDPITKNWLRNFYLVIRDKDNLNTIETYTFKFQYIDDEVETEIYRNNKKIPGVEGKTMQMLTNISAVVKPLGAPPLPCMISIDIDFNRPSLDFEIPKDAAIPGFIPIEELNHKFDGKRLAVNLGEINTAYHDCKLQVRTTSSRLNIDRESQSQQSQQKGSGDSESSQKGSEDLENVQKRVEDSESAKKGGGDLESSRLYERDAEQGDMTGTQQSNKASVVGSGGRKRKVASTDLAKVDSGKVSKKTSLVNSSNSPTRSDVVEAEVKGDDCSNHLAASSRGSLATACPCNVDDDDLETGQCSRCQENHHLVCYGFPAHMKDSEAMEQVKTSFLCFYCSPYLQELNESSKAKFSQVCLIRQVVARMPEQEKKELTYSVLHTYKSIKNRLIKEKLIMKNTKGKGVTANQRALTRANDVYFDSFKTYTFWDKPLFNAETTATAAADLKKRNVRKKRSNARSES